MKAIIVAACRFPPGRKGRTWCGGFALDRNRGADQPDRLFGGDYTFGEPRANSIPKCLALACCLVPHIVLCRMDPIFCRRAGDCLAESRGSLCPDAACGISRALFLVCCRLAALPARCDTYDHFRRSASNRVYPILPLIVEKFSKNH